MVRPSDSIIRLSTLLAVAMAIAALAAGCGGGSSGDESGSGKDASTGAAPAGAEGPTSSEGLGSREGSGPSGSENGTTVTTSALSKAQFVKKANAICRREREELLTGLGTYFNEHKSKGKSPAETFADANRAVYLPIIEADIAKIRALGAPDGDEEEIEAFLEAQQEGVEELGEQKEVKSRFQIEAIFKPAGDLAREYGLKDCANG